MLQKAKPNAIPLRNHVTQQNLTETTENRSALTKTPNFSIFMFIPLYSGLLLGCQTQSESAFHLSVFLFFIFFPVS